MCVMARLAGFAGLLLISSMLASGCSSKTSNLSKEDPLFGGTIAASANPIAPPAPAPLPPPPVATPTSNAVLAPSPSAPLNEENELRIADPARQPGPPATTNWSSPGATGNNFVPASTASATLSQPVPISTASRNSGLAGPAPPYVPPVSDGSRLTYEQAQVILRSYGVTWQRLETWGDDGQWKFSCSVPNPNNAYISRNYEARGATYLDAIQAVLEQLRNEQR
ncbi:MAG: hypothetical protein KatS3mg105_1657 [Gemmatales bacterium]|nr:MAG: hypothetical protein KatS3mg105_1657 [Gemmatales bacterium]